MATSPSEADRRNLFCFQNNPDLTPERVHSNEIPDMIAERKATEA